MKRLYINRKNKKCLNTLFRSYTALLLALVLLMSSSVSFFAEDISQSGGQIVSVSKFELEIIGGYDRQEDDTYIWTANTSSSGHTFMFNILFQTSGKGEIAAEAIKITIPKTVIKDKNGNFADLITMSVPHIDQVTDELKASNNWAYYEDEEGNLVIININPVDAGQAFQFNFGYMTTNTTFNYEDMAQSGEVFANLEMTLSEDGEPYTDTKGPLYVAIDTNVSITQTNKKTPTELDKGWNYDVWGAPPGSLDGESFNPDDYYYLVWEVESVIDNNSTQYYDFSLNDYDFQCKSPFDSDKLKIIGYNFSGNGNSYSLNPDTVYNQDIFGSRRDYVLTAIPKEWYDNLEEDAEIELENSVKATVHPTDHKDADTEAESKQTFRLKKPKFTMPIGNYTFNKNGGRRAYQLDEFNNPNDDTELKPYVYDITAQGYSFDQTYDDSNDDKKDTSGYDPKTNPDNYGKKKLHYELKDNTVSLEGYVGDNLKEPKYTLEKDDYYFTSVGFSYDIKMVAKKNTAKDLAVEGNLSFNDDDKVFNLTEPNSESGYEVSFDVFGEFDGKYEKIAKVWAYSVKNPTVIYEGEMNDRADIRIIGNGFTINFKDDSCTGYKIVTSDDYYYSATFKAQPSIQLKKDSEDLQEWINSTWGKKYNPKKENRVTELQVKNTANFKCTIMDGATVADMTDSGIDYQNESKRQSVITKDATAASNNPLYQRYEISWKINIYEYVVVSNDGASRIPVTQYGGEFFDLLPKGSSVDMSTIRVYKEGKEPVEFTAKTLPGINNRVLLRVTVDEDQKGEEYTLTFTTYHTWEDIAAFGTEILNPVAYITGNDDMADTDGAFNRGGEHGDSVELMKKCFNSLGIADDEWEPRAIFNYEPFDIIAAVMANIGINKTVKNASEGTYTTKTVIDDTDSEYSYRLRSENGLTTKSINNVFVDFMEAFTGSADDVESNWYGKLKSIDVSNLLSKNTIPRVYYSTDKFEVVESSVWYVKSEDEKIKLVEGSADTEDTGDMDIRDFLPQTTFKSGDYTNEHWILIPEDLCDENGVYHLEGLDIKERITAIVVDFTYADPTKFTEEDREVSQDELEGDDAEDLIARNRNARITKDNRYIMGAGEAAYIILNMDNSSAEPIRTRDDFGDNSDAYQAYLNNYNTYNDIFFASSIFSRTEFSSNGTNDTWVEQNYTTVSYRVRSDFYAKKVDATKPSETIGGITFNLSGVSDYGTVVNITVTTTSNGILEFENLELGRYTLKEVDCGRDWLIDNTEYTVIVDSDKKVYVTANPDNFDKASAVDYSDSAYPFVLTNKPRAHADIVFDKRLYGKNGMSNIFVAGATFQLSGVSDYNNDIKKIAVSDYRGRVYFEDVEKGTYKLVEVGAPDGYARSNIEYTVTVDEHNNWSITTTAEPSLIEGSAAEGYKIGNEKYKEFYLQKRSSQAIGPEDEYLLNGAVFNLSGTSDDGDVVDIDVETGASIHGNGVAYFGNLKNGTYYLREKSAPVYEYTEDGKVKQQKFFLDQTIYTVTVDESGVTIKDSDGNTLTEATNDKDETIDNLYTFVNEPVSTQVIVRKVWKDNLTPEERIKDVQSPNIVISREPPEPFKNVYAIFDYKYEGRRDGKLANELTKNNIKHFKRWNASSMPGGITATIISRDDSPELIYGWFDAETKTYYWYTKATGAYLYDARDMFSSKTSIETVDLNGIDFSKSTSFEYMFNGCSNLENVKNLTRPADAVSASAEKMFNNCQNLGSTTNKLDLTEFDTTGITNMSYMFNQAIKNGTPTVIDWGDSLNTGAVKTFFHMFDTCSTLTLVYADIIDTNGVTDSNGLAFMFCNSKALVSIPNLKRDIKTSVSMEDMFNGCQALETLDLSEFYTTGATSMHYMFNTCKALTKLDLSHFDTKSVETMERMFAQCTALKDVNLTGFDTSSVKNMANMFDNCNQLTVLDISSFTKDKLTNASIMFYGCVKLQTIYANNEFDLSDSTINTANIFGMGYGSANYLKGGKGTAWSNAHTTGEYARVDGGTTRPGYFTLGPAPKKTSLSSIFAAFAKAVRNATIKLFNVDTAYDVTPYDESEEQNGSGGSTGKSDDNDYRNSANHGNETNTCSSGDDLYVIKSKDDLAELAALIESASAQDKEHYQRIYDLVKNIGDNEWIYVFDDVVGEDFYVWEENIPAGYIGDFDNYLEEDGTHRITQIKDGVATITNTRTKYKVGSLTIGKRVFESPSNEDVSYTVNKTYKFEITLIDPEPNETPELKTIDALYYQTNDTEGTTMTEKSIVFVNGKATVEIQSGYSLKLCELSIGTQYKVEEIRDESVISTKINGEYSEDRTTSGEITKYTSDVSVDYVNTIQKTGMFMLEKLVQNDNGISGADTEYLFTVVLTGLLKNTQYSVYDAEGNVVKTFNSDENGAATAVVNLKDGDVFTFKDIPDKAVYHIIEAGGSAYISSYEVTTGESNANTTAGKELATQDQTMDISKDPVKTTFKNRIIKTQSVKVKKQLVGLEKEIEPSGEEKKYKFVAQFSNLGPSYWLDAAGVGVFQADEFGNLEVSFLLKAGDTADFNNIPVGAEYIIYEDYDGELIPYYEVEYTDETTGETRTEKATPRVNSGGEITEAAQEAETELDAAQNAYNTAASLLSSYKKGLDLAIADLIAQLSAAGLSVDAENIAAFTADNYVADKESDNGLYSKARAAILGSVTDSAYGETIEALKAAETAVDTALYGSDGSAGGYFAACDALAEAEAALEAVRGPSYVDGDVKLNENTDICFSNIQPYDITISKQVEGNPEDKARVFRFKVQFKYNDVPLTGSYSAETTGTANITDSGYSEQDDKIFSDDGWVYFTLKDGDAITFKNLPYGTTYTIVENVVGWISVKVSTSTNGKHGETTTGGTTDGTIMGDVDVKYVNHFLELPSSGGRGVFLCATTGAALICLAFMLYRRKKFKEKQ